MSPLARNDAHPVSPFKSFLRVAVWLGLAYGILEGLISLTLSLIPGALTWRNANSAPILLVAPVVYAALYGLISVPAACFVARRPVERWWIALLTSLSFYLLCRIDGRLFSVMTSVIIAIAAGVQAFRVLGRRLPQLHRVVNRSFAFLIAWVLLAGLGLVGGIRIREAWLVRHLSHLDPGQPNVILLVMDTERADHLSSYGYPKVTTPNLDALARHAVKFEQAYSSAPWTLPSHASMMTGRTAREHGAGILTPWHLDRRFPTIAERMRDAGYATGGFVSNLFWTGRSTRLNRGFIHYDDYFGNGADALNRTVIGRIGIFPLLAVLFHQTDIPGRRRARQVNRQLLTWLDGLGTRPFFAFLNYNDVHQPYRPPPETAGKFGSVASLMRGSSIHVGAWDEDKSVPAPDVLKTLIARYDESLLAMDAAIGTLLQDLEHRGLLDHTMIIVVADHGEHFGEHGLMGHGQSVFAVETHVPLLIKDAGDTVGRQVGEPVSTMDLAATIADRAGLNAGDFPGRSLLKTHPGRGEPVYSQVQSRIRPPGFRTVKVDVAESLREGDWQFIQHQSGATELYSPARDPGETIDLADSAAYHDLVGHFERELAAHGAPGADTHHQLSKARVTAAP